ADIDAVDYLVESSDADEPYGEPTDEDVAAAASLHRVTAHVEGTPDERLSAIFEAVMSGCEDDGVSRVAHDTFQYDKTPASELSNNWMNRKEPTREVADTRPYKENAPGQWTRSRKDQTHEPSDGGYQDPNPTYYQGGSGKVIPDDMRLAAAWGPVLRRTAGVFQAPPALVSAIERWAIPLYAGHIMAWALTSAQSMQGDPAGETRAELARVRARIGADLAALSAPGDTLILPLPKLTSGGTKDVYYVGVRLVEPEAYLLDEGDKKPTFRRRDVVEFPKSLSGVLHRISAPTRHSILGQLEALVDKYGGEVDREGVDRDLVNLRSIATYARTYAEAPVTVKSSKKATFRIDATTLGGWRYADRVPADADARLSGAGLDSITVELNFVPRQTVGGQWDRTTSKLELDIPKYNGGIPYPMDATEFRDGVERLRGTIRHECQHVGQDVLRVLVGMADVGGIPPRDTRDLSYNPSGTSLATPPRPRQDHALRDVEFFTRIQDEVDAFVRVSRRIPPEARRRVMRVWTGVDRGVIRQSEFGIPFRVMEFFGSLRLEQPAKWRRAVAEFVAGVEAAGVRLPVGRPVLP
ncbi:MAG: hypothetical protein EBT79_10895, partial [Actinobacteria bacterium]|nr:hypothetical protein [Actinomycetota bacterium]